MAQTQSLTNEGMAELVKLMCGEAATCVKSMCCIKTSCTADTSQTAAGITKATESGLTIADCDSVTSTQDTFADDTIEAAHVFTAAASATILGVALYNDDNDAAIGLCCLNAAAAMESADTLTMNMQIVVSTS